MRQLKFVSLSEDGMHVVCEAGPDELFMLPIDERLRAAARGDVTRLGQIEIELENPLRPRDIQARIRAGESAEQLAAAAKMPLDRVLRFAYPVLQEREQVAAEARRSRVRRPESSQQRTLGEIVDERMVARGVVPDAVSWDSWRRDDGGWTVVARWRGEGGNYMATWAFDLSTRSATPADETAADLVAEHPQRVRGVTPVTPLAVAAQHVTPEPPARPARPAPQVPPMQPVQPVTHVPQVTQVPPQPPAEPAPRPARPAPQPVADPPPQRPARPAARNVPSVARERDRGREREAEQPEDDKSRRARVPSWDDILLGVRRKP